MNNRLNSQLHLIHKLARWIVPSGIYELLRIRDESRLPKAAKLILQLNRRFQDIHTGKRCFILATGPSIKSQNLLNLKDEWCFGVSDFYKHRDYKIIKPDYYCLAPLHAPFSDEDGLRRFEELRESSHKDETFFFGLRDKRLFERSSLANAAQNIHFLNIRQMDKAPREIDLTHNFPNLSSVSIMAISIAIYMGFSNIYLLGCDHNNLWTWDGKSAQNQLQHFYDGVPSIGYQHQAFDIDHTLRAHLRVREQYKWVNQLAQRKNAKILNATPGSYIDIFPRVNLEDVVSINRN